MIALRFNPSDDYVVCRGTVACGVEAREEAAKRAGVKLPDRVKRADGDEDRVFSGLIASEGFNGDGIEILADAWRGAIPPYMEFPLIQASHDLSTRETIGGADMLEYVDGLGLFATGRISRAEDAIWMKMQEGFLRGLSVQARINEGSIDFDTGIVSATDVTLYEFSVVPLPFDRKATAELSRALAGKVGELHRARTIEIEIEEDAEDNEEQEQVVEESQAANRSAAREVLSVSALPAEAFATAPFWASAGGVQAAVLLSEGRETTEQTEG